MNLPLSAAHRSKVGTCPHGLPPGACPICSGAGGGGGSRKMEKATGEMSWDECFAVGKMLKAQNLAQHKKDINMQAQLHIPLNTQGRLENIAQKIAGFVERLTNFTQKPQQLPAIIAKPHVFIAKLALPVLNVLKDIPILINKGINFAKEKLADITDKLNAIFGELKNSTEKKISEKFKDLKKRFKSLFELYDSKEADNEDKKIEEGKRIFELKNILQKIQEKKFKNKEVINGNS